MAKPLTFVVSTRIGDPASLAPLRALLRVDPGLHFKLDPTASWDEDLLAELAPLGCVDVIDMKGHYSNVSVAMDADLDLYRRVIEGLPGAWIEDPVIADHTIELLDRHRNRITWDEPIHSVDDIEALPWRPGMLNFKPARFGSVRRLFEAYDYCAAHGIGGYGGGMFEQGPGRGQLQYLASLFHPDGPNDLAPVGYNLQLRPGRSSALAAPPGATPDWLPLGDLRRVAPASASHCPGRNRHADRRGGRASSEGAARGRPARPRRVRCCAGSVS